MLSLLGLGRKSTFGSWIDRFREYLEQAAGTLENATGRAAEVAETTRERTGPYLREAKERARTGARAGRDAVSGRLELVAQRAAAIRERREQRRAARREVRRRRQARPRAPMQLDVRRDDRVVLRGRRPVDLRTSDGGTIRYRYYARPSFLQRAYFHLTGRQVWPRRRPH
ncbi:MAG: hypothetical protein AMS21_13150 [Gemmatimonas sp. SG8_38_2]|nr:MAG: hypothetical protein AMS21_13150 [Gemmatimonas sp. SG8_38_2]